MVKDIKDIEIAFKAISESIDLSLDAKFSVLALIAKLTKDRSLLDLWIENVTTASKAPKNHLIILSYIKAYLQMPGYHNYNSIFARNEVDTLNETLSRLIWENFQLNCQNNDNQKINLVNQPKKFLFVISYLHGNTTSSSHIRQVASYTTGIARLSEDYQVMLLITHENSLNGKYISYRQVTEEYLQVHQEVFKELGDDVLNKNLFINYGVNIEEDNYFDDIYSKITKFNPNVVLCWGGTLQSTVFSRYFFENYPTVLIQFQSSNSVNDLFDIYLSQGYVQSFEGRKNPEKWRNHKIPMLVFEKRKTYLKHEVKKSDDEITIVTTLGGGRIEKIINTYNKNTIDNLVSLLNDYSNTRWVFIGVKDLKILFLKDSRFKELYQKEKIDNIAYENDLRAFYEHCDIYIHLPNFTGGATGVALAIAENIPVVAYKGTDACNFLDKSVVFDNLKSYFDFVKKLIGNKDLRIQKATEAKEKMLKENSTESCARGVILHCKDAVMSFMKRKSI